MSTANFIISRVFVPPLAIYVAGWLLGVALAPAAPQPAWAWLLLSALGAAGGAFFARRDVSLRNLAIAVALAGLGGARWAVSQPVIDPSFIAFYNDSGEAAIEGVVVDEPDVRDTYVNLRVEVDTLLPAGAEAAIPVHGTVLVQAPRFPAIGYGQRIRAHGSLESPPAYESFNYADHLARQGVFAILRRANAVVIAEQPVPDLFLSLQLALLRPIFALKARALAAIAATFPEPQGALLAGILLGVETGIPAALQDAFRTTGTSHIVAISGFNISVLAKVFAVLFQRLLGERRAIPATLLAIGAYTVLAGADASVVRAALMGGIVLVSGGFRRTANGLASLALAAFVMTLYNPGTFYDVGFQLSVAATLGLILYAEPFKGAALAWLTRRVKPETAGWLVNTFGETTLLTLAAQVTTLPLMAYYFRQISIISLVANFIILPAQPAVMILGGLAVIGAMLSKAVGGLLYWLAWPFVSFTIAVVELLARVPLAAIRLDALPLWFLLGVYSLLIGLTWLAGRGELQRPAWLPAASSWARNLGLAGLAFGALAVWNVSLRQPDGHLHVTFLDVGDGDAILIQSPSGRYALINGGPSPNALAEALGRLLPVGARTLDVVIAASPRGPSAAGLPGLFDRFTVGMALLAGDRGRSGAQREWAEGLAARGIETVAAQPGQRLDLGRGAVLSIVHTDDDGAMLRLEYGYAAFLFAPGLDAETATRLTRLGQIAPATVLLAPRQGAENSLSAIFLDAVQPGAVVVSVGDGALPAPQLLSLIGEGRALRTDARGAIAFRTDGRQLWVQAER